MTTSKHDCHRTTATSTATSTSTPTLMLTVKRSQRTLSSRRPFCAALTQLHATWQRKWRAVERLKIGKREKYYMLCINWLMDWIITLLFIKVGVKNNYDLLNLRMQKKSNQKGRRIKTKKILHFKDYLTTIALNSI